MADETFVMSREKEISAKSKFPELPVAVGGHLSYDSVVNLSLVFASFVQGKLRKKPDDVKFHTTLYESFKSIIYKSSKR